VVAEVVDGRPRLEYLPAAVGVPEEVAGDLDELVDPPVYPPPPWSVSPSSLATLAMLLLKYDSHWTSFLPPIIHSASKRWKNGLASLDSQNNTISDGRS
jgi:hypothetical protein